MRAPSISFLSDPAAALKERPDFVDLLPVAVTACDAEGRLRWFNRRAAELWGRQPRIGDDSERFCGALDEALRTVKPLRGREATIERPDGTRVAAMVHVQPVKDASGRLLGAISCFQDTGELPRDAGLVELNHRVNNNMQMLHALLRGAGRDSAGAEAKAALADAGRRVGAMAGAQEVLYDAKRADGFEIRPFLNALCRSAQQAFGRKAQIRCTAAGGHLRSEAAMPLALMLDEMIALLLEPGPDGVGVPLGVPLGVDVSMTRQGDTLRLTVAGGQAKVALERRSVAASGVGLVKGLAAQLGGTFRVEQGGRTGCIVEFPEN